MKSVSGLAYRSSETPDLRTYEAVAHEYYDEWLHPTCADFRSASSIYLQRFFEELRPDGRVADIGCGRSLIANFRTLDLVLVDQSPRMLEQNASSLEKRCVDVESQSFGIAEFDWVFAVLGDPYNSMGTWNNICRALKPMGECVFIVISSDWAKAFRRSALEERANFARFLTSTGEAIFLRSLIVESEVQKRMIADANLTHIATDHVRVGDLPVVRSTKISAFLSPDQNLLDIYRAKKG